MASFVENPKDNVVHVLNFTDPNVDTLCGRGRSFDTDANLDSFDFKSTKARPNCIRCARVVHEMRETTRNVKFRKLVEPSSVEDIEQEGE